MAGLVWEKIDDWFLVWRCKVPGGWLVVTEAKDTPTVNSPGITYLPDAKWEWAVDLKPKPPKGLEN
jgi:hypothetical protein